MFAFASLSLCVCVPVASPLPPHVSASRRTCSTPQVLVPGAGAVPASSCLGELLEVMLHMFRVFRSLHAKVGDNKVDPSQARQHLCTCKQRLAVHPCQDLRSLAGETRPEA